jgi:hypothetical protein
VVSCAAATCVSPTTIGSSTQPWSLATDGVDIYWRDTVEQKVFRCAVGGCSGGAEVIAKGQPGLQGTNIALDGEYVYWSNAAQVLRRHK